jgi:tetratricopeptide (TPR) repeat protein
MNENAQMTSLSLQQFQYRIGASLGRGDLNAAAEMAANCRAAWPDDAAGWLLGSIAALLGDDKDTALALIDARLALQPTDVQCLMQKAECLLALGRRESSLEAAESAANLAHHDPAALDSTGAFFVHAGEHQRALAIYDRTIALRPADASLLAKRATVHRFLGDFTHAAADFEAALRISPQDAGTLSALVELRRQTAERNSVPALQSALTATAPKSKDAALLHFALAKSFEDLGDTAQCWRHLNAGNAIERAHIDYNPTNDRAIIERIMAAFPDPEGYTTDTTDERPIFIVGLPRTGTTLVERILGSHSEVHAAGELPALLDALSAVAGPLMHTRPWAWLEFAATLGRLDGAAVAAQYLSGVRARRGTTSRFTDKQPANYLYCGPILRAFPHAAVVHLTRHPLAACYAIYKARFDNGYPFSYDLTELADFYIGYRRLMAHWHRVFPGRILDVAYEDLVKDQQAATGRLLHYVGLPFEDACLDFHLNPAASTTASSVQVRQPLYQTSLDQWRCYAAELAPLRARLETAGINVGA